LLMLETVELFYQHKQGRLLLALVEIINLQKTSNMKESLLQEVKSIKRLRQHLPQAVLQMDKKKLILIILLVRLEFCLEDFQSQGPLEIQRLK
jgi:hypothetical protein